MATAFPDRDKIASNDGVCAAVEPVIGSALASARQRLEAFVETPEDRAPLAGFIGQIHRLAGAFRLSGAESCRLLAERIETLANAIQAGEQPPDGEQLDVLASASAELDQHFARGMRALAIKDENPRAGAVRAARAAAVREVRVEIARLENTFADHRRDAEVAPAFETLSALAARLALTLDFLALAEAAKPLRRLARYFARRATVSGEPADDASDRIADVFASIECRLDALESGRGPRASAFEHAERALAALGVGAETDTDRVLFDFSQRFAALPDADAAPRGLDLPPARDESVEPSIVGIFFGEAADIAATLATACAHWRRNPLADREALATLHHCFYRLAGSARTAGALRLGAFAATLEDLLGRVATRSLAPGAEIVAAVAEAVLMLPALLEQFRTGAEPSGDPTDLVRRARTLACGAQPAGGGGGPSAAAESDGGEAEPASETQDESRAPVPRLDQKLYAIYRAEALGHLAAMSAWHEARERGEEPAIGPELHRAAHTLAGCSKMAGVEEVGALMTPLEQALERAAAADTDPQVLAAPIAAASAVTAALVAAYGDRRLPLPPWRDVRERLCALRDALPEAAFTMPAGEASLASAQIAEEPAHERMPEGAAPESGDPELIQLFAGEAAELLEGADVSLRAWRADHAATEPPSELLRRLHTLKGGARMAGIAPFADLVHDLESFFTRIADGFIAVSAERLELGEHALDELHRMLEHVGGGRVPTADALRTELRRETGASVVESGTKTFADEGGETPAATRADADADAGEPGETEEAQEADLPRTRESRLGLARVRTDLLETSINNAGEVGIYRGRIGQQLNAMNLHLVELERTVERVRSQMRELEMEIEAQISSTREQRRAANLAEFDPLEFDRYTHIHELSRSLTEAVADLTSLRSLFATGLRLAGTALDRQGRVNAELQDALLRTRMMPFALSEGRLRRVVRQVAEETGKRVEFRFTDMGGEMDRLVLEHILPALEHLLRNAVVHGIESTEERRRCGKPANGRIELIQRREGAETVIEVADDGGGLDLAAIRARAEQEGLVAATAEVSERELVDLVFRLGFTTAGTLSQAAGRGVGMNVVAAEARYVGGAAEIASRPGEGTQVVLRFPATLAIGHTLLIRVGARRYLVPLAGIGSIARVSRTSLDARLKADTPSYEQGGESYRLVSLARVLGEEPVAAENEVFRVPLLLVRAAGRRVAFIADDMEGSREVVIKPVGPQVAHIPGISGATFFDDGTIGLLLDLAGLVRATSQFETGAGTAPVRTVPVVRTEPLVMVADDSITVRRVTERLLARHGVRVLGARDGVEALELLADHTPALLLLDIEMPRMNGYELAEHMRNDERLRAIPIIMITSRVGEKHRARATALGIEHYLGKPYLESELLAAIRSVMGGLDAPAASTGRESAHER